MVTIETDCIPKSWVKDLRRIAKENRKEASKLNDEFQDQITDRGLFLEDNIKGLENVVNDALREEYDSEEEFYDKLEEIEGLIGDCKDDLAETKGYISDLQHLFLDVLETNRDLTDETVSYTTEMLQDEH